MKCHYHYPHIATNKLRIRYSKGTYIKPIKFLYQPSTACHIYVKFCEILIYMYVFKCSCDNQFQCYKATRNLYFLLDKSNTHTLVTEIWTFQNTFTNKIYKRKDSSFIY